MQDAGYKPGVRVFQRSGSVFGARCSVLGVDRVPGPRCPVPDTWYPVPGGMPVLCFEKPAHGVCRTQDRKGPDPGYPVPGTW
jgi:hypothetical protein